MKKTSIFLMIFILCANVFAQKQRCSIDAWVQDDDPQGTNVRNAPNLKGKIIETFPSVAVTGEDIDLTLIGYQNGWLKIELSGDKKNGFKTGWISAKKVAVAIESGTLKPAKLYAFPKRSSRRIGTIPNDASVFEIVGFDCFGLKIKYKDISGWLSKDELCGNPRTTCP